MESALKIASYRPSAPGTGLGLADGSRRLGRRGGPTAERRMVRVLGRPTRSHRDRPGRCGSHVRRAERHIQTNPPVTAFTDGGGKEGGVASAGLADGQLFMGCQPADMRYRRGDVPRRCYYVYDYKRVAADMVQS